MAGCDLVLLLNTHCGMYCLGLREGSSHIKRLAFQASPHHLVPASAITESYVVLFASGIAGHPASSVDLKGNNTYMRVLMQPERDNMVSLGPVW